MSLPFASLYLIIYLFAYLLIVLRDGSWMLSRSDAIWPHSRVAILFIGQARISQLYPRYLSWLTRYKYQVPKYYNRTMYKPTRKSIGWNIMMSIM